MSFTLLAFLLFTSVTFFSLLALCINANSDFSGGIFLGILICLGITLILELQDPTVKAYRLGQINAICGKIEYERTMNPDSTITWKYINDEQEK